jgi:DNA-binding IscR family transcriptional regulator
MNLNKDVKLAFGIIETLNFHKRVMDAEELAFIVDTTTLFIRKIAHKLVKSGLIKSQKGPNGGYVLNKTHIHALEVLTVFGHRTDADPTTPEGKVQWAITSALGTTRIV